MRIESLAALHESMRGIDAVTQQFVVHTGATAFNCLFSVCEQPYKLALTSLGNNPQFLLFDVEPGYWISTYLGEQYQVLLQALLIDGRVGARLETNNWFQQLDAAIPTTAYAYNVPNAVQILQLRRDMEDRDRPYFMHWARYPNGPSAKNLQKTLLLLGANAYRWAREHGASSHWTAIEIGANWQDAARQLN